jgi:hypothetical protein
MLSPIPRHPGVSSPRARAWHSAIGASWNEILNVNRMSYVFCAKAAVPLMRRNQGGALALDIIGFVKAM